MRARVLTSSLVLAATLAVTAGPAFADPWPLGVCARSRYLDDGQPICVLIDPR